jgi:hypothetical protein
LALENAVRADVDAIAERAIVQPGTLAEGAVLADRGVA